jgi:hypothetical protein
MVSRGLRGKIRSLMRESLDREFARVKEVGRGVPTAPPNHNNVEKTARWGHRALPSAFKKKKRGTLSNPALCWTRSTERSQNGLPAVFAPTTATATATATVATITTAAAATTAASATAVAAAATTASGTVFTWTRFIHRQGAAIEALAIERLNRGVCVFFVFHGDKRETARAAAEFVHDQVHFDDVAVGGEHVLKLVFCGVEGKVSYKQFRTHDDFTFTPLSQPFPTIGFQIINEALFN